MYYFRKFVTNHDNIIKLQFLLIGVHKEISVARSLKGHEFPLYYNGRIRVHTNDCGIRVKDTPFSQKLIVNGAYDPIRNIREIHNFD